MECLRVAVFVLLCNGGLYTLVTGNMDYYDYDYDYLSEDKSTDDFGEEQVIFTRIEVPTGELPSIGESPSFDLDTKRIVTAVVGQTATLSCTVRHKGDRLVYWRRKRDLHIFTFGGLIFTPDNRIRGVHLEGTDWWQLVIDEVQKKDNGTYTCIVKSNPPIELDVVLNVEDRNGTDHTTHIPAIIFNGATSHRNRSISWLLLSLLGASLWALQMN